MLFDTQMTCVNALQDVGTDIYICTAKRLDWFTGLPAGAVLKLK